MLILFWTFATNDLMNPSVPSVCTRAMPFSQQVYFLLSNLSREAPGIFREISE